MDADARDALMTEANYASGVLKWARAVLLQVPRIRQAWVLSMQKHSEMNEAAGGPEESSKVFAEWAANDQFAIEVHFLYVVANQLIDAGRPKNSGNIPKLSADLQKSVVLLRDIVEHWEPGIRREFSYVSDPTAVRKSDLKSKKTADKFKEKYPKGRPYMTSGSQDGARLILAGVLDVNLLEDEARAIEGAATSLFNIEPQQEDGLASEA